MATTVQAKIEPFSEPVSRILKKYGEFPLPLTRSASCDESETKALLNTPIDSLFPGARCPEGALSGLLLIMGSWSESHRISQDLDTREGNYWHAIGHRVEPDSWNAAYWFRKVGQHPIFPQLRERAHDILEKVESKPWNVGNSWDPFVFIEWCYEARQLPNSIQEYVALHIQKAEWQLLFNWCAESTGSKPS